MPSTFMTFYLYIIYISHISKSFMGLKTSFILNFNNFDTSEEFE